MKGSNFKQIFHGEKKTCRHGDSNPQPLSCASYVSIWCTAATFCPTHMGPFKWSVLWGVPPSRRGCQQAIWNTVQTFPEPVHLESLNLSVGGICHRSNLPSPNFLCITPWFTKNEFSTSLGDKIQTRLDEYLTNCISMAYWDMKYTVGNNLLTYLAYRKQHPLFVGNDL